MPERIYRGLEGVQTELRTQVFRLFQLIRIGWYAYRIGDTVVFRKIARYRGRTGHRCPAESRRKRLARGIQSRPVDSDDRFRKLEQLRTSGDAKVQLGPHECQEVHFKTVITSTLTEELRMCDGSVKAVVER